MHRALGPWLSPEFAYSFTAAQSLCRVAEHTGSTECTLLQLSPSLPLLSGNTNNTILLMRAKAPETRGHSPALLKRTKDRSFLIISSSLRTVSSPAVTVHLNFDLSGLSLFQIRVCDTKIKKDLSYFTSSQDSGKLSTHTSFFVQSFSVLDCY